MKRYMEWCMKWCMKWWCWIPWTPTCCLMATASQSAWLMLMSSSWRCCVKSYAFHIMFPLSLFAGGGKLWSDIAALDNEVTQEKGEGEGEGGSHCDRIDHSRSNNRRAVIVVCSPLLSIHSFSLPTFSYPYLLPSICPLLLFTFSARLIVQSLPPLFVSLLLLSCSNFITVANV